MYKILAINPGSTSTKIGVFEDEKMVKEFSLHHSNEELRKYTDINEEIKFRQHVIEDAIAKAGIDWKSISAISCRGGIIKPVESGTYEVDENIIHDSIHSTIKHPSNLAALIGNAIGKRYGIKAYITDPPSTYEASKIAAVSGSPLFERPMTFHALNHKAVAKRFCREHNFDYNQVDIVIAHMGGGCSIGMHQHGRVIDVTDALSEGPFTPERSGSVPLKPFLDLCYSGKYDYNQMFLFMRGQAGFQAYLGTNDVREVLKMIDAGDEKAKFYFEAMVYQVAKDIGAMATITKGKLDAIILTGGVSRSKLYTDMVTERIKWIAPVYVYPGEEELQALDQAVLNVLRGIEKPKVY